jgi:hypothetical protein
MNYRELDLVLDYLNEEDQGQKLEFKDKIGQFFKDKSMEQKEKKEQEKEKTETYQKINDYRKELDTENTN